MASHFQRSADILPFGRPADYPVDVRFIRPHELAAINGDRPDLVEQLSDQSRIRELKRQERDGDLRIIGIGLLGAYLVVVVFMLSRMVSA